MNYETSRTVRRTKLPQGIIRRMSVSVLIDHNVRWEPGKGKGAMPKKVVEPPSADELKVIHDVVAAASGFNSNRGDQLTVDSLPFEATLQAQPPASMLPPPAPAPVSKPAPAFWKQPAVMISAAVSVLVIVAAMLLFLNSRKKSRLAMAELQKQLEAAQTASQEQALAQASEQMDGEAAGDAQNATPLQLSDIRESFKLPPIVTTKTEILTKQLVEEAREDPAALAQIIRSWLNESP
jgi:flagellar M-ring protein FliF